MDLTTRDMQERQIGMTNHDLIEITVVTIMIGVNTLVRYHRMEDKCYQTTFLSPVLLYSRIQSDLVDVSPTILKWTVDW